MYSTVWWTDGKWGGHQAYYAAKVYLIDTWGLIASSSEGSSDVAGSYIGERSESSTVVVREYMIVRV